MFHPVGPQPPNVYWRRRLVLLGSVALLLILLVLTVRTMTSDGSTTAGGETTSHAVTTPPSSTSHSRTTPAPTTSHTTAASQRTSAPAPANCRRQDLSVTAVASKPTYQVGDQPLLELEVTNTGARPCVEDLADRQVELRVYNGESRVWGSHDCQIQPGTDPRVLAVNMPVRVAITWSGYTSQPHCAGTRQRVGAGTYTLYALLAGKTGKATQFTIS